MHLVLSLLLASCASASAVTPVATSAAAIVIGLANGHRVDPSSMFVVEGGGVLRPTVELAFQDLAPYLLDARYETSTRSIHYTDPFRIELRLLHRFAVPAGELVVELVPPAARPGTLRDAAAATYSNAIDQVAAAGRRDLVRSIVIVRKSTIAPTATTLRAFQKWAAEHP